MIEEYNYKILALFALNGKRQCKVIPMGALNAAPTFVAMMMELKMEWYTLAKECGLENFELKIIVDDVLLYGRTAGQILDYFSTVVDVLKHHRTTLKMKNCKWFQNSWYFLGVDVAVCRTQPSQSKNEAFAKIYRTNTWEYLCILIGIFVFYIQFR